MKEQIKSAENESNVSGYSKSFPAVFEYSKNDILRDSNGKEFIDFFSGAGALNYGHNNEFLKTEILEFFQNDSPVHCLDMDSIIKINFLNKLDEIILKPKKLDYKIQFPGPTGTNAIEAAIKLARKVTKRSKIISFTHSFHGMTATSLALSGSQESKHSINPSQDVIFFPFDGFFGDNISTIEIIGKMVQTPGSGVEKPAAIILETVQAEGGVNIASNKWLNRLAKLAKSNGILLIIDDIQVGCGRTGDFFSFERSGIIPDIVLLSKSISGYGFPLSLVLIKPEFDIWLPGEHNGTFRANNLSLLGATKALDHYWRDDSLIKVTEKNAEIIKNQLDIILEKSSLVTNIRGIGMIWGIEFINGDIAEKISKILFKEGMIIETCGNLGQVVKLLAPLTITPENLNKGLNMLRSVIFRFNEDGEINQQK